MLFAGMVSAAGPASAESATGRPSREHFVAACAGALTRPTAEQARRYCRCLWRFAVETAPPARDPALGAALLFEGLRPRAPGANAPAETPARRQALEQVALVAAVCTEAAVLNILDAEGHPAD